MPALEFGLKVFGVKELETAMRKLPGEIQRKVMRTAVRKSAARFKNEVLLNVSGRVLKMDTGGLERAIDAAKVFTALLPWGTIAGIDMPGRVALGIPRWPKDKKWYYPIHLEYGTPTSPAFSYIRKAVNDNESHEVRLMANDLAIGAKRFWRRLNKPLRAT